MNITLESPLARNGGAEDFDVRQVKKALNRLGYYRPFEKLGVTEIPDGALFDGIKRFQVAQGLRASGEIKPDDDTVRALNTALEKAPDGLYVWRTVQDDKVRSAHAMLNGMLRKWSDAPDPGDDYNCRCWAEAVPEYAFDPKADAIEPIMGLKQEIIGTVNQGKKWTTFDFAHYFALGNGKEVTLSEIGYLNDVIDISREKIFPNLEKQVENKIRQIKSGPFAYRTEKGYQFSGAHWVLGKGVVQTQTVGKIKKEGDILTLDAEVTYMYSDEITDPISIREAIRGHHRIYELPDNWWGGAELFVTDLFLGRAYAVNGTWKTKLSGSISVK